MSEQWCQNGGILERTLRFVICSRNRPDTLRRSLDGLRRALREASLENQAACCIVDDSTQRDLSAQVRTLVHEFGSDGFRITLVDQKHQYAVNNRLSGLEPEALRLLRSATRPLGHGPWDLARARNLAFLLAYCESNDDDLVVFLDDDILLTSAEYRGRFVEVDGAALLRELIASTPPRSLTASGAAYLGQFDGSILDHLQAALEEPADLRAFPATLPVRLIFEDAVPATDGPGISGALLATTPAALRSRFLPACYNEDWIWLTLLGKPGAAVRKAESRALHAAPANRNVDGDLFSYQSVGEVVYLAVESAHTELSTSHFLAAKETLLCVIGALLEPCARHGAVSLARFLEHELAHVKALDPAALHAWFRRYLEDIPVWHKLLDTARDRLSSLTFVQSSARQ